MSNNSPKLKKWLTIIAVFVIVASMMYSCEFYIALAIWLCIPLLLLVKVVYSHIKKGKLADAERKQRWHQSEIKSKRNFIQKHADRFQELGVDVDNLTDDEIDEM